MPMTYSNVTNAPSNADSGDKKGSLLSFLNRKAATSRSAGGKLAATNSTSAQAYEDLRSEVGDGFGALICIAGKQYIAPKG